VEDRFFPSENVLEEKGEGIQSLLLRELRAKTLKACRRFGRSEAEPEG
jgi:hypothetical protein